MIRVSNIQRFATHDGPGIRTTVFLKGCPLHCPWCANPETWTVNPVLMHDERKCVRCHSCQHVCSENAITFEPQFVLNTKLCTVCGKCTEVCMPSALSVNGREVEIEDILQEVGKDADYYRNSEGGVTLSGGEPLVQHEETMKLLKALKDKGYHTAIETTGMYSLSVLKKVIPYVDLFLFDLKHIDKDVLYDFTGGDLDLIVSNLDYLSRNCPEKIIIRTPVIPGFNRDILEDIILCARNMGFKEIDLLPYHSLGKNKWHDLNREYRYEGLKMMDKAELSEYVSFGEKEDIKVKVGG